MRYQVLVSTITTSSHWKIFETSLLNIFYNFHTFLAVCCPLWCPKKCTKRARTGKSAKLGKKGQNAQKLFNAWISRFWYQPKPRHHIEKFLWLAIWIYIIISRLSWLFVVPSGDQGSVQNGQERPNPPNRPYWAKTHKNFSMNEIAGIVINQNLVITLKNFCDLPFE